MLIAQSAALGWTEVVRMGDIMTFPKRWEDFLHDYEFEDARRIYTNGSRLIPSFRVKQMMEHYAPVVHGRWIDNGANGYKWAFVCSLCGYVDGHPFDNRHNFCPNCGARMDEVE